MLNGDDMDNSVFDAGPFIHLHEVQKLEALKLFRAVFTTAEILEECKRIKRQILGIKNVTLKELSPHSKDFAQYAAQKYEIDLGESTGIALCKQEKVSLFFTDDLDAREAANNLGFDAHGTIALLTRAFREKLLAKKETIEALKALRESTLFVTSDLILFTIQEIERYSKA